MHRHNIYVEQLFCKSLFHFNEKRQYQNIVEAYSRRELTIFNII